MGDDSDAPHEQTRRVQHPLALIRAWLPHLLLLGLLLGALWLIMQVIAPLRVPLLLAGATAMLTAPVLFQPTLRFTERLLPRTGEEWQRQVAGILATLVLVCVVASPLLLIIISVVRSFDEGWQLLLGLALRDQERLLPFLAALQQQIAKLAELYPSLNLDPESIVDSARETLVASKRLGPTFLSFLFKGSGRLAELILALVCLSFFYAHGPRMVRSLLDLSPLDHDQQHLLIARHEMVAEHILVNSLGSACVKGLMFGVIAWLAGIPVPAPLIALLAGILSLLPLVGLTMVWLPLSLLSWSQGNHLTAVLLAVAGLTTIYGFEYLRGRYQQARGLDTEGWMNFALFIGLVGGLLSFGPPGLIIGPVTVAIATVLGRYGLPLYQPTAEIGPDQGELVEERPPE